MEGEILKYDSGLLPVLTRNSVMWEMILQIEFYFFTIMDLLFFVHETLYLAFPFCIKARKFLQRVIYMKPMF
jgi:hypothetical protein